MTSSPARLASDIPLAADEAFKAVTKKLEAGLAKASALPVGGGSVELRAGVVSNAGAFLRLEAALHPLENISLFGFGEVATGMPGGFGPVASAGLGGALHW